MAARGMTIEYATRVCVLGVVLGLPLGVLLAWGARSVQPVVELRARVAEAGGWTPADLAVAAGEPLRLRLTSDDVAHGFAVGQSQSPALDVWPGKTVEATLIFDRPGNYTFYCTRWCGLGHWRMRGTIEVTGAATEPVPQASPLYVALGINIDAPHTIDSPPGARPSAARGAQFGVDLPESYLHPDDYRAGSPADAWQSLRAEPITNGLSESEVWDLVAFVWQSNTTRQALTEAQTLYAANCAACHGEAGVGDGIAAQAMAQMNPAAITEFGHGLQAPTNFTDSRLMLGASPALLQGKIVRGGMGTGMPYWGPIFTEAQTWAIVDYLWTFQFDYQEGP